MYSLRGRLREDAVIRSYNGLNLVYIEILIHTACRLLGLSILVLTYRSISYRQKFLESGIQAVKLHFYHTAEVKIAQKVIEVEAITAGNQVVIQNRNVIEVLENNGEVSTNRKSPCFLLYS